MAVTTATIKMRRGVKANFDSSKFTQGELGVVTDTPEIYFAYENGKTKRIATEDDVSSLSEAIANQKGLSDDLKSALKSFFSNVQTLIPQLAFVASENVGNTVISNAQAVIVALDSTGGEEPDTPTEPENPEVTLTSISATYTGGNVTVGTALTSLTGITVTATYSDGTTKTITGYSLSGEIAEGENTITVTYNGYTTTFKVTGTPSSKVWLTFDTIFDKGTYYSDDGETTTTWGNCQGVWDSKQPIYERDVVVHFRFVINFANTVYTIGRFGSLESTNKVQYRVTPASTYYQEGNGSNYINPGNVYEGTYTLKAGCYFTAGLFPLAGSIPNGIDDLDFTDCYAYIDESEVV